MPLSTAGGLVAAVLLTTVTVTACGDTTDPSGTTNSQAATVEHAPTAFHGTLLDPPVRRPELTLRQTDGQPFAFADRPAGEVTVVFFGYTHCPDLCPTTMADLATARRQLPPDVRDNVTVAFVTEDPQRDTAPVLRRWLDRFDPDFVGLRGGNAQTQRALRELYLPETKRIATPRPAVRHPKDGHVHPGEYGLEHPGIVYAFGPNGASIIYTGGITPAQYAEDFARLAAGK